MTLSQVYERWLTVVGWEGLYEVSDRGQVRSLDRWVNNAHGGWVRPGRILRQSIVNGHLVVTLRLQDRKQQVKVHRLVLIAFAGPPQPGQQARHGPLGPFSNRWPEDLCWGTPTENQADRVRDGTSNHGARGPSAKLTEEIVCDCRHRRAGGERPIDLAAEYGVTTSTMCKVLLRQTWRNVP